MTQITMEQKFASLSGLLEPKSVAVIGASADPTRIGGRPIAAMLRAAYAGRILPVNPKRDQVQGLTCYASVADLPETPDAALIAVPAALAAGVIEALGQRGCKVATLFSAGFAELGEKGLAMQAQIIEIAQKYGMRLLGPNTLGVYNVSLNYYGTFSSSLDTGMPLAGNIGIASQSGAFGAHLAALARDQGLGASVLVTTGNEADITVGEAIGWMAQSETVDVICTYHEGINRPENLLAALDLARAAGKPVFMLKGGRSKLGSSAAASHTASLTGDTVVADAVLRDHGVIRVQDSEQMLDFAYMAHQKIYPSANSMGFITVSGGAGIVASDEAEDLGLPMPPMPASAQAELKELLPICSPLNPLDCTAQAINDPALLEKFTRAALEQGGYASVLCFMTYVAGGKDLAPVILEALKPLRADYPDRLIVFCAIGPREIIKTYEDAGFPVFADLSRAVRALHAMGRVREILDSPAPDMSLPQGAANIALPATTPDEFEAKKILEQAGLRAAPERAVASAEDAATAAAGIGFPVVMKILSPDILHKSDIGGVKLGISDAQSAKEAYGAIMAAAAAHAPNAQVTGVLVAKQLSGGVECLMGINRDPSFGPVAAFGLGGIFVEILDDVVIRRCPFDAATARAMILSIKAVSVLTGARGREPADIDALAEMLSKLSVFAACAGPRLVSVDLNPVVAMPEGAFALDAVIELDDGAQAS